MGGNEVHSMAAGKGIGILWGGGLGDLLVLRPLLLALNRASSSSRPLKVTVLTTATHLPHLFTEFCHPTHVRVVSPQLSLLPQTIRSLQHRFDLIYLGPHPRWKTLLLAMALRPRRIWQRRYPDQDPYILEQVLQDIRQMGLARVKTSQPLRDFLPWKQASGFNNSLKTPFIVVHATSKPKWQTTRWPTSRWQALLKQILGETGLKIVIVGVKRDQAEIETLVKPLQQPGTQRISVRLSNPIHTVADLIDASAGVVCHNSGILHLATFLEKPTLCLNGASARFWRPCYPWVRHITSGKCRLACNQYRCPLPWRKAACIRELPVDAVWKAFVQHLSASASGSPQNTLESTLLERPNGIN